ncbi:MFS transporter [Acidiphilium acidophilum]|uniref:MFS transporter n=1 Tax=Acidiphilium acidophilum TaxID=76588 RepID=UPI002E8E72B7|nr:MFS transporter [Acidiphilium acidophilum]
MGGYFSLLSGHWRPLGFGLLLMALSCFGQTFFIALFNGEIGAVDHLSAGALGACYAAATIGSAFTLRRVGRWLDLMSVRRYALGVAALLCVACIVMGAGRGWAVLILSFYLLRLAGQGLMVHTALTGTARRFPQARGKALGLVSLGLSGGEAILPGAAIGLIALVGWRNVWFIAAFIVVLVTGLAILLLPARRSGVRQVLPRPVPGGAALWRDPRIYMTMPAVLAGPFFVTGFFFQQTSLLAEKHWPITLWASMFVAYAVARAASMLLVGPVIDRIGAARVLPVFLIPLAVAMATIAFVRSNWGVPVFLIATGVTNGITATLLTALWAELFGAARLAEVRSSVESANVIATALSPIAMGLLIDAGVPLANQAIIGLLYVAGTIMLVSLSRKILQSYQQF